MKDNPFNIEHRSHAIEELSEMLRIPGRDRDRFYIAMVEFWQSARDDAFEAAKDEIGSTRWIGGPPE